VTLVQDLDLRDLLTIVMVPGSRLSIEILDDDIGVGSPRFRQLFARQALQLVQSSPDSSTQRLGNVLWNSCVSDRDLRKACEALLEASATPPQLSLTAYMVLGQWEERTGALAAWARQLLYRNLRRLDQNQKRRLYKVAKRYPDGPLKACLLGSPPSSRRPRPLEGELRRYIGLASLDPNLRQAATLMLSRFALDSSSRAGERLTQRHSSKLPDPPSGSAILANPELRDLLASAMSEMASRDWESALLVRDIVAGWIEREPVGRILVERYFPDLLR